MALNAIAWTCFEMKLNLREAVGWARHAVEKSERDAAVLDTLANLLWTVGARQEALEIEKEAAGKSEGAAKREFDGIAARWTAELEAAKAAKAAAEKPAAPETPK
jgi:hypothetical protein